MVPDPQIGHGFDQVNRAQVEKTEVFGHQGVTPDTSGYGNIVLQLGGKVNAR